VHLTGGSRCLGVPGRGAGSGGGGPVVGGGPAGGGSLGREAAYPDQHSADGLTSTRHVHCRSVDEIDPVSLSLALSLSLSLALSRSLSLSLSLSLSILEVDSNECVSTAASQHRADLKPNKYKSKNRTHFIEPFFSSPRRFTLPHSHPFIHRQRCQPYKEKTTSLSPSLCASLSLPRSGRWWWWWSIV